MAKTAAGNIFRIGGWGHLIGDEGSGYQIACRMLGAVMRAFDGGTKNHAHRFAVGASAAILSHGTHRLPLSVGQRQKEIASLAALCDRAFALGDDTAKAIYEEAAENLCEMVTAAAQKFPPKKREPIVCAYTGGMVTKSPALRDLLSRKLQTKAPNVIFQQCRHDAAYGCALMAMEKWESGGKFMSGTLLRIQNAGKISARPNREWRTMYLSTQETSSASR